MLTLLIIEQIWSFALVSGLVYLLSRRSLAGGLSGAFIVLLGLGLWYGWRGAAYLWAAQWTVYAAGILLLWAWVALDNPIAAMPRWDWQGAVVALALLAWLLGEALGAPILLYPFPKVLPTLGDIGLVLGRAWAVLFAWLSVLLAGVALLIIVLWKGTHASQNLSHPKV